MCSLISATSVALIVVVVGAGSGGLFVSYWKRCGSSVLICSVVANSGALVVSSKLACGRCRGGVA